MFLLSVAKLKHSLKLEFSPTIRYNLAEKVQGKHVMFAAVVLTVASITIHYCIVFASRVSSQLYSVLGNVGNIKCLT